MCRPTITEQSTVKVGLLTIQRAFTVRIALFGKDWTDQWFVLCRNCICFTSCITTYAP